MAAGGISTLTGSFTIACADIGTVREDAFGWATVHRAPTPEQVSLRDQNGSDMKRFAKALVRAIQNGPVALGFECPMWVPMAKKPLKLTRRRCLDDSWPWSAGGGALALAVGLTQIAWILARIKTKFASECPPVFFDWPSFRDAQHGEFFWEAFVTSDRRKGVKQASSHVADAKAAIREFERRMDSSDAGDPTPGRCVDCKEPNCKDKVDVRSLIGAALLWADWSSDVSLLHKRCMVVRTTKVAVEGASPEP